MNFQPSLRANAIIGLVIGSVVGGFVGHMVLCWVIGVGLAILASNIRFWAIVLAPIVYILDLINTPPTEDHDGFYLKNRRSYWYQRGPKRGFLPSWYHKPKTKNRSTPDKNHK